MADDIAFMPATQLLTLYRGKQLSPVEPFWPSAELRGCLDKIARPAHAAVKAKIPAGRSL